MNRRPFASHHQAGASLIESLVAILILSFGLLAIGGMMAYAVQLPKMAGNRATAATLSGDLIERMRANTVGYGAGNYFNTLTYDGTSSAGTLSDCAFPTCTAATLAAMDLAWMQVQVRNQLPAGGFLVEDNGNNTGKLWVLWQDPDSAGSFSTSSSDICPTAASGYTNPQPRCMLIPFKL